MLNAIKKWNANRQSIKTQKKIERLYRHAYLMMGMIDAIKANEENVGEKTYTIDEVQKVIEWIRRDDYNNKLNER